MRLRHFWLAAAATASLAALGACKSDEMLGVDNTNNPDVARAFATPDGVENVLKNGFVQVFGATHGTSTAIWTTNSCIRPVPPLWRRRRGPFFRGDR